MITAEQIDKVRKEVSAPGLSQTNDDNIRIAYEWLDAQEWTTISGGGKIKVKRLISKWGGREISQKEIDMAVALISERAGHTPQDTMNPRLTFPSAERLRGIAGALKADYTGQHIIGNYRMYENVKYSSSDGRSLLRSFFRLELPDPQYDRNEFCSKHDNCECYYCVYGS